MTDDKPLPAANDAQQPARRTDKHRPALPPRQSLQADPNEGRLKAAAGGATVRMYRQGLGDCFLLAFPTAEAKQPSADPEPYYVLIDCGVLQGAPNSAANMRAVAQSIQRATNGHIHLLVVTHRHADHISGFKLADDIFEAMTIDNLWLNWTEKPGDGKAERLWKRTNMALAALNAAVAAQPTALAGVAGVLEFTMLGADAQDAGAGSTPADPLKPIRAWFNKDKPEREPEYLAGGAGPFPLPAAGCPPATGVRLYVLGPPTDTDDLAKMDASRGDSRETYLAGEGLNATLAFMYGKFPSDGGGKPPEDDDGLRDLSLPFPKSLQISSNDAKKIAFLREVYGFDDAPPVPSTGESGALAPVAPGGTGRRRTSEPPPAWRRIDDAWLTSGEELALQLDNCVNNTSLVLAIELLPSGKVLLFVGDAQVGNWVSWKCLPGFSVDGRQDKVTAEELLGRTVLYKVGHHGSQNATVAAIEGTSWGLPCMSKDLVALLPVDEEYANLAKQWLMPWPNMLEHLKQQTGQRIVRLDKGVPGLDHNTLAALSPGDRDALKAFAGGVRVTDLYVELDVV